MDKFMIIGQKERFFTATFSEAMEKAIELFQQKQDVSVCKKMSKEYHKRWYKDPTWDWKKQYQEDPDYKTVCRFNWKNRQGITF